jgi:hypothetical protein
MRSLHPRGEGWPEATLERLAGRGLERRRDAALSGLRSHYAAGHVRTGTLEHRVEAALTAQTVRELDDTTWDLPRRPCTPACARIVFELPDPVELGFDGPRTWLVGRSRSCDVVLADPAVSRRHAEISLRGGRCTIRDLASMNGLTVNGGPVVTAALIAGDTVVCGGRSPPTSAERGSPRRRRSSAPSRRSAPRASRARGRRRS